MKSALIVIALLVSTVYTESLTNSDLLDKLDDLLIKASEKNNVAAFNAISESIDAVGMCIAEMSKNKDEQTNQVFQSYIDAIKLDLPQLERMVNQEIKTRGFFSAVGGAFNFVSSKASLLTGKVQSLFSTVQSSGLGGLLAIFEPFVQNIMNNSQVKQLVNGLEIVTAALEQLNKITGGMFEPLNAVTDVLSNIESTGKLFESITSANSSDAIADALINTLTNAKSSHAQKIERALDYVCGGLEDAEKSLLV